MTLKKYLPWSVSNTSPIGSTRLDIFSDSLSGVKPSVETDDVLLVKSVMSWKFTEVKSGDPDKVLAA